jgi:hypothetical protein
MKAFISGMLLLFSYNGNGQKANEDSLKDLLNREEQDTSHCNINMGNSYEDQGDLKQGLLYYFKAKPGNNHFKSIFTQVIFLL